mmetsp:Transcript_90/g.138  ORF Transcript_90/g.138 Transcript_90/m.138 type:complete len:272 (-) Transcript_90:413-1228(-)|eukprot:CAMPEP_0119105806 /NCGR_PEP_ID=MMETSP1180-20130426/3668_1 /TAXON_ID=3052 ORGANISM="Chlamydomonas cf sp, Strain CCMP681" /NCGR_SAMPLE_ID=MMETSP1180 /ASSEMBLY_ACC=CAM_ASM_000741 /LENGTH=271 /DNA_ID=CAMNT_0007090957 /DNA_START=143 /DNA_END=958 /DNA_ORIENTATION=-
MVQLEPNLTLTLKHLSGSGATISAEQQAALDHSLPIKRIEAGLKTVVLWGKILATNGKDYLVAEGYNSALYKDGKVLFEAKYFFSQDGVKWLDLVAVNAETASKAEKIKSLLTGDTSKIYELEEADPNAAPTPVEEGAEVEAPKPLIIQVPELALLRQRIDSINASTGIVPVHALLPDAHNRVVPNLLFNGIAYPDKLESFMHRTTSPDGDTLAQDLRGSWSVQYDPFKQIVICRSLVWIGYTFYYHAHDLTWGALYCGDGVPNYDLIFML